jgi:hypothetical protein
MGASAMAADDTYRQVGEDFKLHDEVLVVITDADGNGEPVAVVFWREAGAAGTVSEAEPSDVEGALAGARSTAGRLSREIVVQLDDEDIWWPHWGTLS